MTPELAVGLIFALGALVLWVPYPARAWRVARVAFIAGGVAFLAAGLMLFLVAIPSAAESVFTATGFALLAVGFLFRAIWTRREVMPLR